LTGGENIYPLEIEERLMEHPIITRAIVCGIKNTRYGEVVGAFLQRETDGARPSDAQLRTWVGQTLGRHKADIVVFWLGEDGVPATVPVTGSGKVRKFELAELGETIMKNKQGAKL
jgi:mevalonyl-CoA ligase